MARQEGQVVFYFGPPHMGKTLQFWRSHSPEDVRVCPSEEFQRSPDLNLRQLVLSKVLPHIVQGRKVVLDGCNWQEPTRQSVINLIQKKKPHCSFSLVKFDPRDGQSQLLWQQEVHLAEWLELRLMQRFERYNAFTAQGRIEAWCDTNHDTRARHIDEPREDSGFDNEHVYLPLVVQTTHKLEVPCLLVEWSSVCVLTKQGIRMTTGTTVAMTTWYQHNPVGRIILVADTHLPPGVDMVERHTQVEFILKQLVSEMRECPVYLYAIEIIPALFHQPPQPGILAFLMRLHHLNLQHPSSLYLYDSLRHQKMAAAAGMKHIKGAKFFSRPQMAACMHPAVTTAAVPDVLRHMEVCAPVGELWTSTSRLPLLVELASQPCGICNINLGHGRRMYCAVNNTDVLNRYQSQYADMCMLTGSQPSRIAQMTVNPAPSAASDGLDTSKGSAIRQRDLPSWMLARKRKEENVDGNTTETAAKHLCGRFRKTPMKALGSGTVYVMSAAELLDYAQKVCIEAGFPLPAVADTEGDNQTRSSREVNSGHAAGDVEYKNESEKKKSGVRDASKLSDNPEQAVETPAVKKQRQLWPNSTKLSPTTTSVASRSGCSSNHRVQHRVSDTNEACSSRANGREVSSAMPKTSIIIPETSSASLARIQSAKSTNSSDFQKQHHSPRTDDATAFKKSTSAVRTAYMGDSYSNIELKSSDKPEVTSPNLPVKRPVKTWKDIIPDLSIFDDMI